MTYAHGTKRCHFEWPRVTWYNFRQHGAWRGLSETAKLLVDCNCYATVTGSKAKFFVSAHQSACIALSVGYLQWSNTGWDYSIIGRAWQGSFARMQSTVQHASLTSPTHASAKRAITGPAVRPGLWRSGTSINQDLTLTDYKIKTVNLAQQDRQLNCGLYAFYEHLTDVAMLLTPRNGGHLQESGRPNREQVRCFTVDIKHGQSRPCKRQSRVTLR